MFCYLIFCNNFHDLLAFPRLFQKMLPRLVYLFASLFETIFLTTILVF